VLSMRCVHGARACGWVPGWLGLGWGGVCLGFSSVYIFPWLRPQFLQRASALPSCRTAAPLWRSLPRLAGSQLGAFSPLPSLFGLGVPLLKSLQMGWTSQATTKSRVGKVQASEEEPGPGFVLVVMKSEPGCLFVRKYFLVCQHCVPKHRWK
jgi:hypothetical protein